ncbi:MAG: hypothetical protein BWY57_03101 [Betaproteobacteria bacterium ADurb.Bin341]|nr:MAG: hypothetical protein BWY57_03101 [Betaproteobacteria bacterium ADurb.Bin341]
MMESFLTTKHTNGHEKNHGKYDIQSNKTISMIFFVLLSLKILFFLKDFFTQLHLSISEER